MSIVVTLNPKLEALLHSRATKQGQDVNFIASELLANILRLGRKRLRRSY